MESGNSMKITQSNNSVIFEHLGSTFSVVFNRTIRLPEDGRTHQLPPGLGHLPVKLVDDYRDKVPASWREQGGVFIPLHQREAMWLGFSGAVSAVKTATGKVNAVNGKPWTPELVAGVEDYMVAPHPQNWLDGFNSGNGVIKQFVAMPMGMGYTVEGQVTGKEEYGGLQLLVIPAKSGVIPLMSRGSESKTLGGSFNQVSDGVIVSDGADGVTGSSGSFGYTYMSGVNYGGTKIGCTAMRGLSSHTGVNSAFLNASSSMGLAAGGQMAQKIYPDPHGIGTWDQEASGRLFVHIVNAEMYELITGEKCPPMPISAQEYAGNWFKLNDFSANTLKAPVDFQGVKTVGQKDAIHGFVGQQNDSPTIEKTVITYPHLTAPVVRDGKW